VWASALSIALLWASYSFGQQLPPGFVYLRDLDPTIEQDIRYAGPNNFTGHSLAGYDAAECVLREAAARALAAAQADLAPQGLSLKVYDCYRPIRAVQEMLSWAAASVGTNPRFYPKVPRGVLIGRGYIAGHSTHSTGLAADATLVRHPAAAVRRPGGACSGPVDDSVDMGTTFDCFDRLSSTASSAIGVEPKRHRALLITVMARHNLANYRREWWHFTFSDGPRIAPAFDFPIVARPAR
jgi:D-alanyl-D-alanine dipeptidase